MDEQVFITCSFSFKRVIRQSFGNDFDIKQVLSVPIVSFLYRAKFPKRK